MGCLRDSCKSADIIALQETWLLQHDIPLLGAIDTEFAYTGNTAVDLSAGILRGRPYGGVALLWLYMPTDERDNLAEFVSG
ncbi:unnamed protein product, partial [Iphiclides podalirius]